MLQVHSIWIFGKSQWPGKTKGLYPFFPLPLYTAQQYTDIEKRKKERRRRNAGIDAMKKMILVTSPPACGKTYISKQLAENLKHVVYLDKDTLIPLSNRVFIAAGQEINRSSDFFEENIRDYEYEAIVDIGVEALAYDDIVLINAPFTKEVHNEETLERFRTKLRKKGAKLVVIWVVTDPEVCHERMIQRASDRDTWKLEHWDEYIKTIDFSIPEPLKRLDAGHDLILFYNSSDAEFDQSMKTILPLLEEDGEI